MAKKIGIEASLFVQIDLGKTQAKVLRKEWKKQKNKHFLKNYPYFTFLEAEQLFKAWCQKEVRIEQLGIARLDEKGKPTTEQELVLTSFLLDDTYENLLKVFSEALLNDPSYASIPFEAKIDYLERTLFPAYRKSTACEETQVPLLPEYPEEDFMECLVPFYTSTDGEEQERENFGLERASSQRNAFEDGVVQHEEHHVEENGEEEQQDLPHQEDGKQHKEQHENQHFNLSSALKAPALYGLTYFKCRKPQVLDRMHPDYVENELNKQKVIMNQKIKVLDEELQATQASILTRKKAELERDKNQQLHRWLAVHDKRAVLKAQLWTKGKAKVEQLEKELQAEKSKKKHYALEQARLAYECQVEEIQSQFHQETQLEVQALYEEHSSWLTSLYQEEYAKQTADLRYGFNGEATLIDEKNVQELNQLINKMQGILREKDRQIQKMYQDDLEKQREKLEKKHQIALLEQRERDKTEAVLSFQEEVKAVKNQAQALAKEIQSSKEKQEKLLYSIVPRAPQFQEKLERSEGGIETKEEKESFVPLMMIASSALVFVLGSSYLLFEMIL